MDRKMGRQGERAMVTSVLLQAGSIWKRAAEKALVEDGISVARANLLLWVARLGGGVRQVQLAECTGLASQSLVRLLDELSASGLLERREDPDDRRAKSLWLTPEGAALAERVEQVLAELRQRVFADIDRKDIEATYRVLDAIIEYGQ
ncbi:MarR family winged helix-turn-helix transcriptional regulator [Neorhizobium sp. NCHU2750]|uniref:MarR family winged helix-turn-helix transcriptional regulator n=1 Tax=Neorhizobium sp. NCHU2750 TaxID=1825976 RepID=UPI000EB6A3A1|nr:MarR family transcriptional regulator [Neorhizobium sp. NCHU2750]